VRNRLRGAIQERGLDLKAQLEALALTKEVLAAPISVERLAAELAPLDRERAIALLRKAQQRHPGDFNITYALAKNLTALWPSQKEDAIRFMTAAVAIRPRSVVARRELASLLGGKLAFDEAIAVLQTVIEIDPHDAVASYWIGINYARKGAAPESTAAFQVAVPEFRRLLRDRPADAYVHHLLGHAVAAVC
jgi:Flp pilus assembly protein TadD